MCLGYALRPRSYPEAFGRVYDSFAVQPDEYTCGAAALRHGLLLGGLEAPVHLLISLLEIHTYGGTNYERLSRALRRLGFEVEPRRKPRRQSTADFLSDSMQRAQGGFLLPALFGLWEIDHWVCLGHWDGTRAWMVDSYYGDDGILYFGGWTEQDFDNVAWDEDGELYINVVRPGIWADQYRAWLPARRALLRMPPTNAPASMEAAVQIAAHQFLDDAEYDYHELSLYLPGGVEVAVQVEDEGTQSILVGAQGEGEDRVLVFREASGMAQPSPGQTPPLLVVRANRLNAAWLH